MKSLYLLLLVSCMSAFCQDVPWTTLLQFKFSGQFALQHKNKQELSFSRTEVQPFSQLMCSWNAYRPVRGYYSFWAQVRDAKTKVWHAWHRMMDWGAGVQRSYADKTDVSTDYHHVRLELKNNNLADAVRLKVIAHDGAPVTNLAGLFVNLANFHAFKPEKPSDLTPLTSVYVPRVPKISQMMIDHHKKEVICSPTSCSILLSYLTKQSINPAEFAEQSFDHGLQAYGSWPFNIAHAFERAGGKINIRVARLHSFVQLHERLTKGIPVVVSVRGPMKGSAEEYRYGHLLVVVGYDAKKREVLCHDPAFPEHKKTAVSYDITTFLCGWERSRRLAYIADYA